MASAVSNGVPEFNILIMGETGVGKSTFINGLVNYMTFETLDDASQAPELLSLIASSFTMLDEDMQRKVLTTGTADNENFAAGQSATQACQVYRFDLGAWAIRVIDTPGIGDVRGIDKDRENFANILQTIGNLNVLHGIVILLKPNNARLGVMFRFCVQELLTHLHRSATGNIVFGFTNSRGTFYRPGDTFPALEELLQRNQQVSIPLNKETVYCFDSESYRFLVALKNGVKFDDDTTSAFRESWKRSVEETKRLMDHIIRAKPHNTKDTTSLNHARSLIIKLTKPMAEMTRLIDINIKVSQDKIQELQTTHAKGADLDKALMVDRIDLEPRQLGHPRTVCTESSCIEVLDFEGSKKVNYKTHCHPHCYLTGVKEDTLNTAELMHCAAMGGGQTCSKCGHGYQVHMHVVYELLQVKKQIEDAGIKDQIASNSSDRQKKEAAIAAIKTLIAEYQQEHATVEKAAAQFGCFLKHNAIVPYSDARIEYLDHLLKEERAKAQASGDDSGVRSLEATKQAYVEEFRIIDKSIGDGKNMQVLDPGNVARIESELYKLKHFGNTLRKVRNAGSQAHAHAYKEIPVKPKKQSTVFQSLAAGAKKLVGL